MSEKFVGYFQVVEACERPGCPLCRCIVAAGRRYLDAVIYEQVNDPDSRRYLRASWGFCNWHAGLLDETRDAKFGAAIICEDLLRTVIHRVTKLSHDRDRLPGRLRKLLKRVTGVASRPAIIRLYRRRAWCPVCREAFAAETRYLETLLSFVGDLRFRRAYEQSDGLCVPHALLAIERGEEAAVRDLLTVTVAKWTVLRQDVGRFVSKHDYRNQVPFTDEEISARARVLATLAGERGVFGNDVHRATRSLRGCRRADAPVAESEGIVAETEEFDRRKMELRMKDLTEQLNEATTRAAALHYRLSRVAEDRNVLEMNLTGERGAGQLAKQALDDLRAENDRLRAEIAALKSAPPPPK